MEFLFWWILLLWWDGGEPIFLCRLAYFGRGFDEREISEEVAVLVTSPAAKRDVFIVQGLLPVLVLVFQGH